MTLFGKKESRQAQGKLELSLSDFEFICAEAQIDLGS